MEIKLFRKMDISIEEMKALFEKKKSLQICLEQHLKELEHRKEGLVEDAGYLRTPDYWNTGHWILLNAEDCLEEIEQMEKEGAKFMDINKMDIHKKRRNGSDHWCGSYGIAYADYDRNRILGQHTGSDSAGNACCL